jgi:hypothetical protein
VRKVVSYVERYYATAFDPLAFSIVVLALASAIAINYTSQFETVYVAVPRGSLLSVAKHALFYSVPFLLAFIAQFRLIQIGALLRNAHFWVLFFVAVVIFSSRELNYGKLLVPSSTPIYWARVTQILLQWAVGYGSIWLYWKGTKERDGTSDSFFGLTWKGVNSKLYLSLLALMLPIIALASFQPDFQHMYPRAQSLSGIPSEGPTAWPYFALYELLYGLDYIFIEFFFRGFVVLAFARLCGRSIILPMAAFYVFIHFEKPLGECISSFFGGMLLGIIALETRSVMGGVIVHMGIAWMMEIAAWLHKGLP